jgi:hypothetical protein
MARRTSPETGDTRQRLLNRLGYFKESRLPTSSEIEREAFAPLEKRSSTASLDSIGRTALRSATSFQQKLHDDRATSIIDWLSPRSARVQFNQVVSGVEIPSRHQYSSRIKRTIWASKAEISAMVERNVVEFESEGFDWENVVLDKDMYINEENGELIHPCHYCGKDQYEEEDHHFTPLRRHISTA